MDYLFTGLYGRPFYWIEKKDITFYWIGMIGRNIVWNWRVRLIFGMEGRNGFYCFCFGKEGKKWIFYLKSPSNLFF